MKRTPQNGIDNFCRKHPNFGIPNLMMYIIVGSVAVYLFAGFDNSQMFLYNLAFNYEMILKGQIWRLVTYIFMPISSSPLSFAISLYFYYLIGKILESEWGTAKFTLYYINGVLLTTLCGIIASAVLHIGYLGLSSFFINTALLFAYAILYPDNMVLLFFIIPIKIKYIGLLNLAYFIYNMIGSKFPMSLFPLIAIINCLLFCYDDIYYYVHRVVQSRRARNSRDSVNFRRETREAERESEAKTYHHKCAVCGRTDTDYPELEFRYCSRCHGYHCFCQDHINNHIHFTE